METAREKINNAPGSRKLLIVGLDGGTWKVLRPLMEQGIMPFLASVYEESVRADLISTFPPITAPAWTSLATGMNPGRTGVFDFNNRSDFSYTVHAINSNYFKGISAWDFLSQQGYRVCVLHYPMLYPAYEINGCMISGLGGFTDRSAFYPRQLWNELRKRFGDLDLVVRFREEEYEDIGAFWDDISKAEERLFEMFSFILKEDYDVYFMVISLTDQVQHRAWPYVEDLIASGEKEGPRELPRFWRRLDDGLRSLLDGFLGENDVVFLSDHGFGKQDLTFNLSRWLIEAGYSRQIRKHGDLVESFLLKARRAALRNPGLHRMARAIKGAPIVRGLQAELESVDAGIDIQSSYAYTLDHTIPFGAVYLNLSGREKYGFIDGEEYKRIRERLRSDLVDFFAANNLSVEAFFPEDIYSGPSTRFAPDLVFQVEGGRGVVVRRRGDDILKNEPFSSRHLGSHRRNGIFMAHGPGFAAGPKDLGDMSIMDIMPLLSILAGFDLPHGVDGELREQLLSEETRSKRRSLINSFREKKRIEGRLRTSGIS